MAATDALMRKHVVTESSDVSNLQDFRDSYSLSDLYRRFQ